jgi:prophage regulatory protein
VTKAPRAARSAPLRLLRWKEVVDLTGLTRSGIYNLMARDEFPQNIVLSEAGRSVAWIEQEVIDWMELRVERSRSPDAPPREYHPGPGRGIRGPMSKPEVTAKPLEQTSTPPPSPNPTVPLKRGRGRPRNAHTPLA